MLQVGSGNPDDLRPTATDPWTSTAILESITIKLSENSDTLVYVKAVTLSNMDGLREIQIRLRKDPEETPERVLSDEVSTVVQC